MNLYSRSTVGASSHWAGVSRRQGGNSFGWIVSVGAAARVWAPRVTGRLLCVQGCGREKLERHSAYVWSPVAREVCLGTLTRMACGGAEARRSHKPSEVRRGQRAVTPSRDDGD